MEKHTENCPRCNKMKLHSNLVRNALSRRDNKTYICSTCGEREAFVDYFKYEQIPSEEMEIEKDFHAKVKCDFHKYKTWHKEKDERERSSVEWEKKHNKTWHKERSRELTNV